ncbi:MAG: sugar ABC transporter ATP-binding protein [Lachnospiraceae bacterium]
MGKYILEVKNLNKYFGQNQVLKQVNLSLEPGEIYGLIGANGSGKSTLMNILFGNSVIEKTGGYDGEIWYNGEKVCISSTKDAILRGIGMIHQEFVLIPEMTVADNIKLTRENTKKKFCRVLKPEISYIDKKKNQEDAKKVLEELGFQIDNSYLVKNISVNAKQFVEIAREVDKKDLRLLLLDEPTAVLNAEDAQKLMKVLKGLAEKGTTILFCSHRLHEICEICDRVTIIRDGEVVSNYTKGELDAEILAKDMIGYDVFTVKREKRALYGEKIVSFKDFSVHMPGEPIEKINLDVCKGEILGITSLSGHGKLALGYGVMGMFPVEGDVLLEGQRLDLGNVKKTIEQGIFLLPDDRKNMGLLLEHSICENMIFSGFYGRNMFQKHVFGIFSIRDWKKIKSYAEEQIKRLDIKCENMEQNAGELSGGNQQKVCIARAIAVNPKVLFVMEPTRGVDIGAKEKILDMLVKMNQEKGMTIVVASSELDELKRISDRIAVFCEGKLSQILPPESSEEEFAFAYTGEEAEDEK